MGSNYFKSPKNLFFITKPLKKVPLKNFKKINKA